MDEKRWMDRLKNSAKDVEVPEKLKPDKIEKMLREEGKTQKRSKNPWFRYMRNGGMAAAAVLILALVFQGGLLEKTEEAAKGGTVNNLEMGAAVLETETAKSEDFMRQERTSGEGADSGQERESKTGTGSEEGKSSGTEPVLETEDPVSQEGEFLEAVEDYEDLFEALSTKAGERVLYEAMDRGMAAGGMIEDSAAPDMAVSQEASAANNGSAQQEVLSGEDYSKTNLQEMGVDEGDIVKTDGSYLYVLNGDGLRILEVSGTDVTPVGSIPVYEENMGGYAREMYLEGDRLVILTSCTETSMRESQKDQYRMEAREYTAVSTYSISDRSAPRLMGRVEVDGLYHTSRRSGDYLYLLTDYFPVLETTMEDSLFIPLAGGEEVAADDILLPRELESTNMLVAVSIDLNRPGKVADKKSLVGLSDLIYVSTESIYVARQDYSSLGRNTQIMKFSYQDGSLLGEGAASVPGSLNDSFSMNEYEGCLRVVTTSHPEEKNGLYVLDREMRICGRIEDLAPGEKIYSARFLGEQGYFVTFRNMDPLFSVDLSDPESPRILGELKITGFSTYLHFYGKDRLLGLGNEADPDTGEIKGIKLSMFDISDPSNVKEEGKYVIEGSMYCPGLYNYKAVLADAEKNLIGFACDDNYLVFSYDQEKGFQNLLAEPMENSEGRGVYIGEYFYTVENSLIEVFDMESSFEKQKSITY